MQTRTIDISPEWMDGLRAGNQHAFRRIYEMLSQQLYFFAKTYIENQAEAEDVTAEAFIALWARKKDFDSVSSMVGFLRTTIKNKCLDYLRHQSVKHRNYQELITIAEMENETDFSLQMIHLEVLRSIYAEAEKLPGRIKEVFMMSFREGLKPAEIAAKLDTSIQTVRNQKVTAVRLLRQALANQPMGLLILLAFEAGENYFRHPT